MTRLSFADVLGTNYAPTLIERDVISTMVESMEQELTSLEDVLLPLITRRDKLKEDILAHKVLLAPARRLLPELVGEIFTHTFPDMHTVWTDHWRRAIRLQCFPRPCVEDMPLKLGRICRQWRHIALTTPTLWSKFRIPMNWRVESLQEWIMRAGSCPLSFAVTVRQQDRDVLKTLASYQHRWGNVVLGCPDVDRQFTKEFLGSLSPNYHSLRTLELRMAPGNQTSSTPSQLLPVIGLVIESAPNLYYMFSGVTVVQLATPTNLPSLHLREVDILSEVMKSSELLSLLRRCPAIQSIRAAVVHKFDRNEPHRDIFNLAALKHMSIAGYYEEDQNFCILGKLSLPVLEELSFQFDSEPTSNVPPQPSYTPQLTSLIFRSRPPLKSLHISASGCLGPIAITECLPLLPLLVYLKLEYIGRELNGVVDVLTWPVRQSGEDLPPRVCPQLIQIYFGHGDPWQLDRVPPELIINMILSRSVSGESSLSRVTVLDCKEREILADPRIVDCIENGLEFEGQK